MRRYITAEDLYFHNECQRKVYLAHQDVDAVRKAPSAFVAMLLERGREHEAAVARNLHAQRVIFEPGNLESGFRRTLEAMKAGWPVIHGGVLIHDGMAGIPDLMLRVDEPSVSWKWHYRPIDIKLGSSLKAEYELQVMMYVHLLEQLHAFFGQLNQKHTSVVCRLRTIDQASLAQLVDNASNCGGDLNHPCCHFNCGQRLPFPPKDSQDVVL